MWVDKSNFATLPRVDHSFQPLSLLLSLQVSLHSPLCSHIYTYTNRLLMLGGVHPSLQSVQHLFQPLFLYLSLVGTLNKHTSHVANAHTAAHKHTDATLSD